MESLSYWHLPPLFATPALLRNSTHKKGSYEWVSRVQQCRSHLGKIWREGSRCQHDSEAQHHHATEDLDSLWEEKGRLRMKTSICKDRAFLPLPWLSHIITFCEIPVRIQTLWKLWSEKQEKTPWRVCGSATEATVSGVWQVLRKASAFLPLRSWSAHGSCFQRTASAGISFPNSQDL